MDQLTDEQLAQLELHRFVPVDYKEWLKANGWGSLGDDRYMLYDGLVLMSEIHDVAPPGYWSFGDDFSGISGCFSENGDGLVYEWDSGSYEMVCTGNRFPAFVAQYGVAA
jgi:hypothetical protein